MLSIYSSHAFEICIRSTVFLRKENDPSCQRIRAALVFNLSKKNDNSIRASNYYYYYVLLYWYDG